jgi:predicted ATP-grasp superfamily ATP-dependent carboligase
VPGERILVTVGEYVGVLAAVRALSAAGYEPWATSTPDRGYTVRSRAAAGTIAVPDPAADAQAFVRRVAESADDLAVRAILPGTEVALVVLADRAADLPAGTALGAPSPEVVDRVTDKAALEGFAREAGLETPPTLLLTSGGGDSALGGNTLPAVVKPLRSEMRTENGYRHFGARCVRTSAELSAVLHELPDQRGLVQPFVKGRLAAVAGVMWDGEMLGGVHMLALRLWPSDCGLISYAVTIRADPELEAGIARMLRLMDWEGIFQVDLLRSEGRNLVIDLNPRVYGSLALAQAAGHNHTAIWADLLLGRRPRIGAYRIGARYRSEELDPRALIEALTGGNLREAARGLLPHRRTAHAVFAAGDPWPVLTSLRRLTRRTTRPLEQYVSGIVHGR